MDALLKLDIETGFVVRNSFVSATGFTALEGIRNFGTVIIREGVLKGVGVIYLTGVRVFNAQDVLLLDITFDRFTPYSRERVRSVVLSELVQLLSDSAQQQGYSLDVTQAWEKLNRELNLVFYADSYRAILTLAAEWGVELSKSQE